METKKCKRCGKEKPLNEFYNNEDSWCTECHCSYERDKDFYSRKGIKSKMCKACKEVKPLEEFAFKPNGKRGRVCQHCRRTNEGKQLQLTIEPMTKTNTKTNMKNKSLLELIAEFLFGKKYWCNIVNTRGTDKCEMSSYIFASKAESEKHKERLCANASYMYMETISFRSKKNYKTTKL